MLHTLYGNPLTAQNMTSHARYKKPTGDRANVVEAMWGSKGMDDKKREDPRFFNESRNVMLLMNADGASVCQDDAKQCFPIVCEVNPNAFIFWHDKDTKNSRFFSITHKHE